MSTLSVIIPTTGRPALGLVLADLLPQLCSYDEVVLVADGPCPKAWDQTAWRTVHNITYVETIPSRHFGNHQRDVGVAVAKGTHLWFLDDDDKPEHVNAIHQAIHDQPSRVHFFRMEMAPKNSGVVYTGKPPVPGNLATGMVVVPNDKSKLPRWEWTGTDFGYMMQANTNFGGNPQCHKDVIVRGRWYGEEVR